MSDPIARRLSIRGRVQGVAFRASMYREAEALRVEGWVRNRRDGSVEAWVQGAPDRVEAMIRWARRGPPAAHVTDVEIAEERPEPFAGFDLRPTA